MGLVMSVIGLRAVLCVKREQPPPKIKPNSLAPFPKSKIRDMSLRHQDLRGDLVLRQPRIYEISDDCFPHSAQTIALAVVFNNSYSLFSSCYRSSRVRE